MFARSDTPPQRTAMAELMAACPDGDGVEARFKNLKVKNTPDTHRAGWLGEKQIATTSTNAPQLGDAQKQEPAQHLATTD